VNETKGLTCEITGHIACVTLCNPPINTLTIDILSEIKACFEELGKNRDLRAVIFTGSGKSFIAGADINSFAGRKGDEISRYGQDALRAIEECPLAVIAAINGYALGGGVELALCCDIRLASDTAKLGLPEAALGIVPTYGGLTRLPLLIGEAQAKRLMFTAERITAQEAEKIGLVQSVYPQVELMGKAMELAEKIAKNAPIPIALIKKEMLRARSISFEDRLLAENAIALYTLEETEDCKEGIAAFHEKRSPIFRNC